MTGVRRLLIVLAAATAAACAARPVWDTGYEGEAIVLDGAIRVVLPADWLRGAYIVDGQGRVRMQRGDDKRPVVLIAATKEAWHLQRMVWRAVDAKLAAKIYGGSACACQDVACHQPRWQEFHGRRLGAGKVTARSADTVAVAGQPGVRLVWEWRDASDAITWQDVLFCVGPALYQITYAAPSGFFYTRFEPAAQQAIAATRVVR